jgi:hypothetical protein
MVIKPKKTPYQGLWALILFMLLPSVLMSVIAYYAVSRFQPQFGHDINYATAKVIGFGLGILFHLSCFIVGAFNEDFNAVKTRLKEFATNLTVSFKFALKWYWEDVKTLGLALYIDLFLIGLNVYVFVDALMYYFALGGVI